MPFKKPLTFADLRAIRERQPWNPDVLSLLWEVKRLRAALLRMHQVSSELHRPTGLMGGIYDDLLAGLAEEPCVLEREQMTSELLESPRKLRKGMGPR
ncbi:hypothetical protein [Achromobacter denitrificans]|uniref:hypothetical protein n=1 Tax=Achromobacter denitrificans TaxID=32002 RepID=UPI0023E837C5|nr:hypothetical protein [Achromobacter denitrificans]MDF3850664.1 hypothetical protein [Achromobacter denitrificans]